MVEMQSAETLRSRLNSLLKHLEQDPGNITLACDIVDTSLQLGDLERAQSTLASALGAYPKDPGLIFRQSSLALARRNYAEAETLLAELMEQGLDSVALRYNRAQAQLWLRNPDNTIQLLQPVAERAAEYPPLLLLLASACLQKSDYPQAIAYARQYLKFNPEDPDALGLLALIHLDNGQETEAAELAARTLKKRPDQLEAALALSRLALNHIDYERAIAILQPAITRYPTSGAGWSTLAQAEMLHGNIPGAEQLIDRALQYIPEHIGTWHLQGWCRILKGDIVGAKQSFTKAYDIDRNFGETHGALAVTAAMEGDEATARNFIKRALRLNPQGMAVRYAESLLLEKAGKDDEARAVVDKVLDRQSLHDGISLRQLINAHRARLNRN